MIKTYKSKGRIDSYDTNMYMSYVQTKCLITFMAKETEDRYWNPKKNNNFEVKWWYPSLQWYKYIVWNESLIIIDT